MQSAMLVEGRLTSPTTVELDTPASGMAGDVEIILRNVVQDQIEEGETVFEFLRHRPPGTRTKEDIDRKIREERESW